MTCSGLGMEIGSKIGHLTDDIRYWRYLKMKGLTLVDILIDELYTVAEH